MVYAYRLKEQKDKPKVIEGFGVRQAWQYSSDPKVKVLANWKQVVFLEAGDIKALKASIAEYEKNPRAEPSASGELRDRLNAMSLSELKEYARERGLPEAEYNTFTKPKMVDYLVLAAPEKN